MVTDTKSKAKGGLQYQPAKNNLLLQYERSKLKAATSNISLNKSCPLRGSTKNVLLQKFEKSALAPSLGVGKPLENKTLSSLNKKNEMASVRRQEGLYMPPAAKPVATKSLHLANNLLTRLANTETCPRGSEAGSLANPILQRHESLSVKHRPSMMSALTQTYSHTGTENKLLAPSFTLSRLSPEMEEKCNNVPEPRQQRDFHQVEVPPLCHDDFEKIQIADEDVKFPTADESMPGMVEEESPLTVAKTNLIGCVCTSLINSPVWFSASDKTRVRLHDLCERIADKDPEFILKVALYTRLVLNIRATCNFLLALASYLPPCRPFLKKYFCKAIVLPSDWIQVTEFYQSLSETTASANVKLPSALRRVMVAKFPEFDLYQLGKYNKDKAKTSKKKKAKKSKEKQEGDDENAQQKVKLDVPMFTLKYLIRKLHLTKPAFPVMCILGKKYPDSVETYYKAGLEGTWDSALSGKRMKLEVPETWETQVSAKGNQAQVWEDLLSHRKLPFMAMLRNIRNMIKVGVAEKYHTQILKTLTNERAVSRSRQFPFRFFSAYEVLTELEADIEKQAKYREHGYKAFLNKQQKQLTKAWKFGDTRTKTQEEKDIGFLKKQLNKKYGKPLPFEKDLLQRYRKALNEAVKIATVQNVPPICGHTVVICDVRPEALERKCSTAKGLGSARTQAEVGILLGLMCAYSCEACTFMVCSGKTCKTVELEKCGILENLARIIALVSIAEPTNKKGGFLPSGFMREALIDRIKFTNLLVLSKSLEEREEAQLATFLRTYTDSVNSGARCYTVDLTGKRSSLSDDLGMQNVTKFSGYSEQILKFIALGGGKAQLNCVSNVDKKFDLASNEAAHLIVDSPQLSISRPPHKPWRTIRVFISSTIKDMLGERNALIRYVFPTLRDRARGMCLHLVETDLRWGITADDAHYGRSVGMCLQEVRKCDVFIGILGERYGWVPKDYGFPEPGTEWLNDYPKARSITELEINQAAFPNTTNAKKCFFYFRNSTELKNSVPKGTKEKFFESNSRKRSKLDDLKKRISGSEHSVLEDYPAEWGGFVDGCPTVGNLDQFAERVVEDLWGVLDGLKLRMEDTTDSDQQLQDDDDVHLRIAAEQNFEGRSSLFTSLLSKITTSKSGTGNVVALVGKSGSGRSALLTAIHNHLAQSIQDGLSCIHYVSPSVPGSESVTNILRRFCMQFAETFHFSDLEIPSGYGSLLKYYTDLLEKVSRAHAKTKLCLLVDDVQNLDSDIFWIHKVSHPLVTVAVTCPDSGATHAALKHMPGVVMMQMTDLTSSDKRSIVRSILGKHSKKLDESHFNNQMQVLLSKRQSANPLYLSTVCEMMRVQETFESLSGTLKALPHDLEGVLSWQLDVVEARFSEYHDLVAVVLGMIYSSMKWKISEGELYEAVCLRYHKLEPGSKATDDEESGGKSVLPRAILYSLLHSLKSFVLKVPSKNGDLLTLSHSVHMKLVEKRYLASHEFAKRCHATLANLHTRRLREQVAQSSGDEYVINETMSRLPVHLASSEQHNVLRNLLTDFDYIQFKCRLGLGMQLLEEYAMLECTKQTKMKPLKARGSEVPLPWQEMQKFIVSNIHTISSYPEMIYQLAINQNWDSYPFTVADDKVNAESSNGDTRPIVYLEHLNRSDDHESHLRTFKVGRSSDKDTSVATFRGSSLLAYGSDLGKVGVLDAASGNVVFAWSGHNDTVSSVCFLSKSVLLSACIDGTISMWNVVYGYRIASFQAHNAKVTGMVVRPAKQGGAARVFVTSSHDRSIAIWKASDGKMQSRLKTDGSPANCIAFHPHEPRVVVGLWDCTLRVWDIQTLRRTAVIRGHLQAVCSVQFSSSGTYIASCSFYESVIRLWAAGAGIPLGNFGETFLTSPTALTYSHGGQYLIGSGEGTNEHCSQIVTWSSHLGKEELKYQVPNPSESGNATCCSLNYDKEMLAVGFHQGSIGIYDAKGPTPLFTEVLHESPVTCLAWTPGPEASMFSSLLFDWPTELLIAGSSDGTLKAVDPSTFTVVASFTGHSAGVLAVDCSLEWIASGSEDFDILLWPIKDIPGSQNSFAQVQMQNQVQITQSQSSNGLRNPLTATAVKHSKALRGHEGPVSCLAFNPDGTMLVSGGRDGKLAYWNINDCEANLSGNLSHRVVSQVKKDVQPIATIDQAHMDWITCCSWNDSSDHIVTGSNDAYLKVWAAPKLPLTKSKEHTTPLYILKGHESGITSVKYRLGCISSTGGEDNTIRIWSHRGVEITSLKTPSRTNCCDVTLRPELDVEPSETPLDFGDVNLEEDATEAEEDFNWAEEVATEEWNEEHKKRKPGSKKKKKAVTTEMQNFQVVCASNDASVSLWKPLIGDRVNVMNDHSKSINMLESGESQVVSCSSSGSVKLWNIKATGEATRHEGEVTCILVLGGLVVSSCDAGFLYVWRVEGGGSVTALVCKKKGHKKRITSIVLLKDMVFVTTSYDGSLTLWKVSEVDRSEPRQFNTVVLQQITTKRTGKPLISSSVKPLPDGYRLHVKDIDGNSSIYNIPHNLSSVTSSREASKPNPAKEETIPADGGAVTMRLDNGAIIHSYANVCGLDGVSPENVSVAGCSQGYLHVPSQKRKIKIHESRVTVLLDAGEFLVSGSFDCTLKLWRKPDMTQVGHFTTSSPVTTACLGMSQSLVFFGDSSGMLNIVKLR